MIDTGSARSLRRNGTRGAALSVPAPVRAIGTRPLVMAPPAGKEPDLGIRTATDSRTYGSLVRPHEVRSGTLQHEANFTLSSPWHQHDLHQIEYGIDGVVEIHTYTERLVLSPRQAAWIPAGTIHRAVMHRSTAMSIFLDPDLMTFDGDDARVITLPSVLHEMAVYAVRWPIQRTTNDVVADTFFTCLAHLVEELLRQDASSTRDVGDPTVQVAMAYTQLHLQDVSINEVCRVAGTSERTFRRTFGARTGMTWRQYVTKSRLESGQAMLRGTDRTVADVAHSVGFDSVSAFTRAYTRMFGEPPAASRRS